jgi:hypothetical protein
MARDGTQILESLFSNAINVGLVPSRFDQGRIGLLFAVLAAEEVAWETVLDNYKQEGFLQTAVVADDIIKLAAPLHYQTPALPSKVVVKFYWVNGATKVDTTIPFGQVIQTVDSPPIQYRTMSSVVLYADAEYVLVSARSIDTGLDTMVPAEYITVSGLSGINVINDGESWGGADIEDPKSVRQNAISARFSMEKGTSNSFGLELSRLGIQDYQYNLVDLCFGNGTFALYIDTTVDEFIDEIIERIMQIKAAGIYGVIEKVEVVPFTFDFYIEVASKNDITPDKRNSLIQDLTGALTDFVTYNGVGQTVVISVLTHYLLDELTDKYNLFDLNINTSTFQYLRDSNGNIVLQDDQILQVTEITVTTSTAD